MNKKELRNDLYTLIKEAQYLIKNFDNLVDRESLEKKANLIHKKVIDLDINELRKLASIKNGK